MFIQQKCNSALKMSSSAISLLINVLYHIHMRRPTSSPFTTFHSKNDLGSPLWCFWLLTPLEHLCVLQLLGLRISEMVDEIIEIEFRYVQRIYLQI